MLRFYHVFYPDGAFRKQGVGVMNAVLYCPVCKCWWSDSVITLTASALVQELYDVVGCIRIRQFGLYLSKQQLVEKYLNFDIQSSYGYLWNKDCSSGIAIGLHD